MEESLKRHKNFKLIQEETENLNELQQVNKIWTSNSKSSHKKRPGPWDFTGKFYELFEKSQF